MKKKLKGEFKDFPSVTLYRDDLEEILTAFNDHAANMTISDSDFEYLDFEEVKAKRGAVVRSLTISSDSPVVSVSFGSSTAIKRGGDIAALPIYATLETILSSKTRRVLSLFFCNYMVLVSGALLLLLLTSRPVWAQKPIVGVTILLALMAVIILSFANQKGAFSKLVLKNRNDELSFWMRNKDQIIVGIISAIVGAFLALLVAYLLFQGGIK